MKIAVIADVHSNIHSLNAVLEDIEMEKPDRVVGAGDMVGCSAYPGAAAVWKMLIEQKIPFVLGNEEERILDLYDPAADPDLKYSIQYWPLQYRAGQFTAAEIETMKALPMTLRLPGPQGQDVLVCHASPGDLHRSPMRGIDAQMARELDEITAKVIVVGHYHTQWHQPWQDKLLIMAGSAGLPLRGKPDEVDYLLLTFDQKAWQFVYKTVKYDYQAAIREVVESGFLEQAGPVGWLMFDEALTQEDHLVPFLCDYCPEEKPENLATWTKLVTGYLTAKGHWETVKPYVQQG